MKRFLAFLLLSVILTTNALAADIYVDTWKVETGAPPTVTGDQVLAPAQDIFAALGATATLDPATSSVLAVRGATQIWIQAGNPTAFVSGAALTLSTPAQLINGQLMVPVSFVAEALGCGFTWDAGTQTAAVANILNGLTIYDTKRGERWHLKNPCGNGEYFEVELAAAYGKGLSPCEKCVLTQAYEQAVNQFWNTPITPAPAQSPVQTQAPGPTTTPPAVPTPAPPVQPSAPVTQAPAPTTPAVTQPAQPQAPAAQGVPPVQPSPPAQTPQAVGGPRNYQRPVEEPLWLIVDSTQESHVPAVVRPQVTEAPKDSQPGTPSWLTQGK